MTSSGMKRGLAAVAVSALAVTGLPLLAGTAQARPLSDYLAPTDDEVHFISPWDGIGSVKYDGTNSTVSLVAVGGDNVNNMTFQWKRAADATWKNIGTVGRNADGAFVYEWNAAGLLGEALELRALGNSGQSDLAPTNPVTVYDQDSTVQSVELGTEGDLGVFQQPYGAGDMDYDFNGVPGDPTKHVSIMSGTTSATSGSMPTWRLSAINNWVSLGSVPITPAASGVTGIFRGLVDMTGYAYSAVPSDGPDQVILSAEPLAGSGQDAEASTLYKQEVTSITAVAKRDFITAGENTEVVVTVLDQKGKPIPGVQIGEDLPGPVDAIKGYTGIDGKATIVSVGSGTHTYYANTTDGDNFDANVDKAAAAVSVTEYDPAPTKLTPKSAAAMDFDETLLVNGITITVEDQKGFAYDEVASVVRYTWSVAPFDGSPTITYPEQTLPADTDGVVSVPLPAGGPSGTYTLTARREASSGSGYLEMPAYSIKVGQADIKWDDETPTQAAAGTSKTLTGKLVLEDGTALPGRRLDLAWQKGQENGSALTADAFFGLQPTQPAGTTLIDGLNARAVTGADGAFGVTVTDPAETPQHSELNGNVDAVTVNTPNIGNANDSTNNHELDFVTDLAPASISLQQTNLVDGRATPGRPVNVRAVVKNAAGLELTNVPVEFSVDKGFMTPTADNGNANFDAVDEDFLVADPAPTLGSLYGEWKSLGQTHTVKTDGDDPSNAAAIGTVAIERHADFDDDGQATTVVTVKAGGVTKTINVDWISGTDTWWEGQAPVEPLNPGSVEIQEAADQTVSILSNPGDPAHAPTTEEVYYTVVATDQFGNRVRQWVDVSDNDARALVNDSRNPVEVLSQWTVEDHQPNIWTSSDDETNQKLSVDWTNRTETHADALPGVPGFQAKANNASPWATDVDEDTLSDDAPRTIHWYNVNLDDPASVFDLDSSDASRPVGSAVTMTVKVVDQHGEPVFGLPVEFLRSGPNAQQGDVNWTGVTNQNGIAYYNFVGDVAGKAKVSAAVINPADEVQIVKGPQTITFGSGGQQRIDAALKLSNQADGDDVAKVDAPSAAKGATVRLYKVKKDGSRVLLATKKANSNGNAEFVVNDTSGGKSTTYQAKVAKTSKTFADWTPKRSIK